jgi:methylglyoxal/glyoxal reductase
MSKDPYNTLDIPPIGFGTWKLSDEQAADCVAHALQVGYRLIDTAAIYGNEAGVGAGIKKSGIDREDIFVTTKLWNDDQGYDSALAACEKSMNLLGLDYLDLYLIHWPNSETHFDAWRALVDLRDQGKVKHIGVSNFTVRHLEELQQESEITPYLNQIEFHPRLYTEQKEVLDYCRSNNIAVEAYSPLAQADLVENQTVRAIAKRLTKTPAQILLRWAIEKGAIPIPKSSSPDRIKENLDVFNFELDDEATELLDGMQSGDRVTHDPAEHD